MTETSIPWAGTTVGDAGPYSDDEWSDVWRKLFSEDRTLQGVVGHYANELAVTNPAGVTIRVATGAALVDGKLYETDAVVDNVVVAPGAGSNYYTVVLRKSFIGLNAQTVRVVLLGPDAAAPPAVTQVDGTTWEISLATVRITNVGVITVTDTRKFVALTTAINCMDRQGGSATDWNSSGTTNYNATRVVMQCGQIHHDLGVMSVVTFRKPFAHIPLVICHSNLGAAIHCTAEAVSATSFQAWAYTDNAGTEAHTDILWFAFGEL